MSKKVNNKFIYHWPILFSLFVSVGLFFSGLIPEEGEDFSTFYSSCFSVEFTLSGFLVTAKSILMSLQGTGVMRDLKESGYLEVLINHIVYSINISIFSGVCFFVFMLLKLSSTIWVVSIGTFLFALSISTLWRVVNYTRKILLKA